MATSRAAMKPSSPMRSRFFSRFGIFPLATAFSASLIVPNGPYSRRSEVATTQSPLSSFSPGPGRSWSAAYDALIALLATASRLSSFSMASMTEAISALRGVMGMGSSFLLPRA